MIHPSYDVFQSLSEKGNLIPVYREILVDTETPASTFLKLNHISGKNKDYSFLLESVEGGEKIGRYSIISGDPMLVYRSTGEKGSVEYLPEGKKEAANGNPLEVLRGLLSRFQYVENEELPRFPGGAVGYFSYDVVQYFEPIPIQGKDELNLPEAYYIFSDTLMVFDHVKHTIKVIAHAHLDGRALETVYEEAVKKVDLLVKELQHSIHELPPEVDNEVSEVSFQSNVTQEEFEQNVLKGKEYVAAGDVIQVVLSQRFSTEFKEDPFLLYRVLRGVNPSPYLFFLNFPEGAIVGSSPELMVSCEGDSVEIRPIAGTRKRGKTEAEDLALEKELLADPKERAEHVMLVDLARNDIGRVCETKSVHVDDLMVIERYSHVMHIVSNVIGKLKKGKDAFDLLGATFPAGTVSGAPKVRAMQIIEELENCRRGPYAGTVGYFSFSGNLDSCITIRTMVVKDNKVYVQAGAGIVADSEPTFEYQETINKAKALLKAVSIAKGSSD